MQYAAVVSVVSVLVATTATGPTQGFWDCKRAPVSQEPPNRDLRRRRSVNIASHRG